MDTLFLEKELPVQDLQKIGLYKDGKPLLSNDDLRALLSGRRTELVSLANLQAEGFVIQKLDAKLSLDRSPDGIISLKIHPIYKQATAHELLNEEESALLQNGKTDRIRKEHEHPDGKKETYIIEYDSDTREFVSYQPDQVLTPEQVNDEWLNEKQKEDFKNGHIVSLSDGTQLQYRASQSKGLLSNRVGLVLSIMLDGGLSYLLITGIGNLIGNKNPQQEAYTEGYAQALKHVEQFQEKIQQKQPEYDHNRGRSR